MQKTESWFLFIGNEVELEGSCSDWMEAGKDDFVSLPKENFGGVRKCLFGWFLSVKLGKIPN